MAKKHGLAALLHEKPFQGINGSGKHNNWSLFTNAGVNVFNPKALAQAGACVSSLSSRAERVPRRAHLCLSHRPGRGLEGRPRAQRPHAHVHRHAGFVGDTAVPPPLSLCDCDAQAMISVWVRAKRRPPSSRFTWATR